MSDDQRRTWRSYESPLGGLTLTSGPRGLDGLFFDGRAPALDEADHRPEQFAEAVDQLGEYFAGIRRSFALELDLDAGTPFQRDVWRQLQGIPYGQTISYTELANRLGRPDRVRAAGAAVGRNPLPIIVPCHRVIGADGKLTGYLGGLHRKQALLDSEAAVRAGRGSSGQFGPRQLALL
ncbi:MAG: methylated-DNA--[protein]-cysteine S-methyltransferase [Acidobacteriota bacterium]|nr:methylated-DNA--[protein]-cysteine S-methyltransferase [Acidobacteriota bacterium]